MELWKTGPVAPYATSEIRSLSDLALLVPFQALHISPTHSRRNSNETPFKRILPDSQINFLLWPRIHSKTTDDKTRHTACRRSASPERISRAPIAGRDAETSEAENRQARQEVCDLPRRIHRLQRHRAGPQESQRNGRSVER